MISDIRFFSHLNFAIDKANKQLLACVMYRNSLSLNINLILLVCLHIPCVYFWADVFQGIEQYYNDYYYTCDRNVHRRQKKKKEAKLMLLQKKLLYYYSFFSIFSKCEDLKAMKLHVLLHAYTSRRLFYSSI